MVHKSFVAAACAAVLLVPGLAYAQSPFGGFYIGGHAGYGELLEDGVDVAGFAGGVHGGYNFQSGAMLFGIEGDYSGADISQTESDDGITAKVSFDYLASVRGRLGYASSSALFFATAGYGWSEIEGSLTDGTDTLSASVSLDGFVAGAGIEYKFTQNMSGRIEGLHYWLSGEQADGIDLDADLGVVRGGLTFHFN